MYSCNTNLIHIITANYITSQSPWYFWLVINTSTISYGMRVNVIDILCSSCQAHTNSPNPKNTGQKHTAAFQPNVGTMRGMRQALNRNSSDNGPCGQIEYRMMYLHVYRSLHNREVKFAAYRTSCNSCMMVIVKLSKHKSQTHNTFILCYMHVYP